MPNGKFKKRDEALLQFLQGGANQDRTKMRLLQAARPHTPELSIQERKTSPTNNDMFKVQPRNMRRGPELFPHAHLRPMQSIKCLAPQLEVRSVESVAAATEPGVGFHSPPPSFLLPSTIRRLSLHPMYIPLPLFPSQLNNYSPRSTLQRQSSLPLNSISIFPTTPKTGLQQRLSR